MFEHLDDTRPLPVPTAAEVAGIIATGGRRRRRRQAAALAVPLLAAVTAGVLLVASSPFTRQSQPAPLSSGSATSPAPTPSRSGSGAPGGTYEALVVRGTSLVAVAPTGGERVVRELGPLGLSAADLAFAYVSTAGWLTFQTEGGWKRSVKGHVLVDLRTPKAAPVAIEGLFDQRAWSPDGTRLMTVGSGGVVVIINATTGRETAVDLQGGQLPGGGPDLIWTADGTGVLVTGPGPGSLPQVAPVDGGPLREQVPGLWHRWRRWGAGGVRLETESGTVRAFRPDGTATPLYAGELTDARLAAAALSQDGRSAYVLLFTGPTELTVARSDAARTPSVLATLTVDASDAGIGLSPDDATALVSTTTAQNSAAPMTNLSLVPLAGGSAHQTTGTFAGWVPTTVVDAIEAAN